MNECPQPYPLAVNPTSSSTCSSTAGWGQRQDDGGLTGSQIGTGAQLRHLQESSTESTVRQAAYYCKRSSRCATGSQNCGKRTNPAAQYRRAQAWRAGLPPETRSPSDLWGTELPRAAPHRAHVSAKRNSLDDAPLPSGRCAQTCARAPVPLIGASNDLATVTITGVQKTQKTS